MLKIKKMSNSTPGGEGYDLYWGDELVGEVERTRDGACELHEHWQRIADGKLAIAILEMARRWVAVEQGLDLEKLAATSWEADHQGEILRYHGLYEEFPFGCDSIDHVATALLECRAEVRRLQEKLAKQ